MCTYTTNDKEYHTKVNTCLKVLGVKCLSLMWPNKYVVVRPKEQQTHTHTHVIITPIFEYIYIFILKPF